METIEQRIARLEDEIIRAFNERDRLALIQAQANLRTARDEKERMDFDIRLAKMYIASGRVDLITLN